MNLRSSVGGIRKVASGLAAFVLIFSMFANAFSTSMPDCCSGKMCPIHQKHATPAKGTENSHMDCELQKERPQECSMSCGHSNESGLQETTVVFWLPDVGPTAIFIPVETAPTAELVSHSDLAIRPLTPPPRFSSSL